MAKSVTAAQQEVNVRRIRSYADVRFGDRKAMRLPSPVGGPSRTKQSFAAECDVHTILARFQATGVLPGADRIAGARYMDCTQVDFQEAMTVVASARSMFAELPSKLRDRFRNSPADLLAFIEDPKNLEEARELGLVNAAAKEATPLAVRVVESVKSNPEQTSKV